MKIKCKRDDLVKNLQIVEKATDTKSHVAVLRNVYFSANNDNLLELRGYDHKIGIKVDMETETEESGATTCPCGLLLNVLSVMNDEYIELDLSGEELTLAGKKSKYKFFCIPAEDFPPFYTDDKEKESITTVDSNILLDGIRKTMFAVNPNDPRIFTNGVLMDINKGKINFTGTDGHRLASVSFDDERIKSKGKRVVLPLKTLTELFRVLPNDKVEIEIIEIIERKDVEKRVMGVIFKIGKIIFFSRILEVDYPKVDKIIPQSVEGSCKINKKRLETSLRGASYIAGAQDIKDAMKIVEISITENNMRITSTAQDVGSAYEEIEIEKKGNDITIAYNLKYLMDFISSVDEDDIIMEYTTPQGGSIFRIDNKNYLCVIMPIKL